MPADRRRLLIGALAATAPLPLPLNELLEWPALALFCVLAGSWTLRWRRPLPPLPGWLVNVLGLVYLPLLLADLAAFGRGQPLTPVLHLLLFGTLVKLYGLRREREYGHLLLIVFFVFAASMATSVHPSTLIFLVGWAGLALAALARLAWQRAAGVRASGTGPDATWPAAAGRGLPLARLAAGSLIAAATLAVPLFLLLPRTGSPMVSAGALAGERERSVAGVGEGVRLGDFGRIRESREVVLRMQQTAATPNPQVVRFKAATYDRFRNDRWLPETGRRRAVGSRLDASIPLASRPATAWAEVWLQPTGGSWVPLPMQAVAIDRAPLGLGVDDGGAIGLSYRPSRILDFRIGLAAAPASMAEPPDRLPDAGALLDAAAVGERVRALAEEIAGGRAPAAAAAELERRLQNDYRYTDAPVAGPSGRALEDFLFATRRGHCEYFASAMVLMLRQLGVPARLVTGYLGAEINPIQDYLVVRQDRAHAWVEAWLPERGWVTFDPTPPAGRPQPGRVGLLQQLQQAWDLLLFRWDRHVLGYGLNDQIGTLRGLRDWLGSLWRPASPEAAGQERAANAVGRPAPWVWLLPLAVMLAVIGLWVVRRITAPWSATRVWQRLLAAAARAGAAPPPSLPPFAAAARLAGAYPSAASAIYRLVERYAAESFGATPAAAEEVRSLRSDLRVVEQSMLGSSARSSAAGAR